MKKLLLLALAAVCSVYANAADANWTASVNGIFSENKAIPSGAVTVDAQGNTIVAGAYDQDFTINGEDFFATGTSAYLIKYNTTGAIQWAVSFEGNATVNAVTTDPDGNIYVAGVLSAKVILGSTTPDTDNEIAGINIDGTFSKKKNASFIVKYSPAGALLAKTTFISTEFPESVAAGIPEDDAYFRICEIKATSDKLYAAAVFTGTTSHGNVTFQGYYNDPWFGAYVVDLQSSTVFSLSSSLTDCQEIASCGTGETLADLENQYEAGPVAINIDNDKVFAAFTYTGPCVVKVGTDTHKLEITSKDAYVSFISTEGAFASVQIEEADILYIKSYGVFALHKNGNILESIGNQRITDDNEQTSYQLAFYNVNLTDSNVSKNIINTIESEQYFYDLTGANFSNGVWTYSVAGQWAASGEGYASGDHTGTYKCSTYDNGTIGTAEVANAYTLGSNGKVVTYATIAGTGTTYAQYAAPTSGIDDIVIGDENAPVEYYNLQGIRVDNPTPGMYIMRQGTKTSKVIIR